MGRVSIVGTSGSGKSWLASRLSVALGIPRLELDSIRHQPGRETLPDAEFAEQVGSFVLGDGWVVDGNYFTVVTGPVIWPVADTVVCPRLTAAVPEADQLRLRIACGALLDAWIAPDFVQRLRHVHVTLLAVETDLVVEESESWIGTGIAYNRAGTPFSGASEAEGPCRDDQVDHTSEAHDEDRDEDVRDPVPLVRTRFATAGHAHFSTAKLGP